MLRSLARNSGLLPLRKAHERFGIGPCNQFLKVIGWNRVDIHDCDPTEPGHVTGWLDARDVRQLQEAFRGGADTEAPLLRLAGLEIGELFAANTVGENVARRTEQLRSGAGVATAMFFDSGNI